MAVGALLHDSAGLDAAGTCPVLQPFPQLWVHFSTLRTDRGGDHAIGKIDRGAGQGTCKNGHFAKHLLVYIFTDLRSVKKCQFATFNTHTFCYAHT